MRIGQGFNTYTQTICVDNAVVVDPERAENVVTNDGVTMRILAQKLKKASVWRQLNEYVNDGQLATVNTEPQVDEKPTVANESNVLTQVDLNQSQPDSDIQATQAKLDQDDQTREAELAKLADQAPPATVEEADQALKAEADKKAAANAKLTADREKFLADKKAQLANNVDPAQELAKKDAEFKAAQTGRQTGLAPGVEKVYAWSMEKAVGTSQIVSYTSCFVDKLSEINDDMNASAALSIKTDCVGGSGSGAFIDTEKFHDSDIRFYLSVKCINQTINFKDALVFNPIRSIPLSDTERFTKCFGNAFISGFLEGGELNALVLIKVHNDVKREDIVAEAKVALTKSIEIDGEGNLKLAKKNIELNSEVTINVRWSGGASIKSYDEQWTIDSLLAAANRFPFLAAQFPQRTYAILTKYESLRSFLMLKPPTVSPIAYENAALYTNQLMDAYLAYSVLLKKISADMQDLKSGIKRFKDTSVTAKDGTGTTSSPSPPTPPMSQTLQRSKLQHFPASVAGLDAARRSIRTQMNNIVREVDAIEQNPKIATQDRSKAVDGGPVFVGPASFQSLLPPVEFKVRKIRNQALSLQAINQDPDATQATPAATPASFEVHLFDPSTTKLTLSEVEQITIAKLERDNPDLAQYTRVSPPIGSTTAGNPFCTLDLGLEDPLLSSVRVLCRTSGEARDMAVRGLSVTYVNGVTIEFGEVIDEYDAVDDAADPKTELHELSGLGTSEQITTAKIEIDGDKDDPEHKVRVVGLCLVTSKGQVLNALTPAERSKMSVYLLQNFEKPITDGYVSGFWGQADATPGSGLINRLGLVWTQAVVTDAIFDEDLPIECVTGKSLLGPVSADTKVDYAHVYPDIPQMIWGLRSLQTSKSSKPTFSSSITVDKSSFTYKLCPRDSNTVVQSGWMILPELSDTHIQCGQVQVATGNVEQSQVITFDLPFDQNTTPTVLCWIIDLTADGDQVDVKVGPVPGTSSTSFGLKVSDSDGKFNDNSANGKQLNYSSITVGWLAHSPISSVGQTTLLSGKTEVQLGSAGKSIVPVDYKPNFSGKPTKHFIALSAFKISDLKPDVRVSANVRDVKAERLNLDAVGPVNTSFSAVWISSL
ncbi:hypothetical protein OC845_000516 [Tilletia horrida]|nr:hypothetical protein OC845_000516 [Tilletia horrida]